MGITMREIIYDIGGGITNGKKFKAVQIGGPSGGCLPESMLDLPVDYDSLIAAGAMMGSGGLPELYAVGILRQMYSLPRRHEAYAGNPYPYYGGPGTRGRYRAAGKPCQEYQGNSSLRLGTNRSQPCFEHPEIFQR